MLLIVEANLYGPRSDLYQNHCEGIVSCVQRGMFFTRRKSKDDLTKVSQLFRSPDTGDAKSWVERKQFELKNGDKHNISLIGLVSSQVRK